jgi:hypothetical protein
VVWIRRVRPVALFVVGAGGWLTERLEVLSGRHAPVAVLTDGVRRTVAAPDGL